ncbi:MAG: glycoside hydrolase family 97 catalytic domain-containing protein [Bacteroidaceae bacterium]|nr:glycoside hydrolase family 97 catalytic domain-containing protein [Bacteroidaceae bacterium]
MRRLILFILFPTVMCVCCFGKDKFESPNHQLRAEVNGQSLTVYYKNKLMVTRIHLGVMTEQGNLDSDLVLRDATAPKEVKVDYTMVTGKKRLCHNQANEKTFTYTNPNNLTLEAIVRLYNDGVAIRYRIPQSVKVIDDRTAFYVASGVDRWIAPYDFGNEQPFPHDTEGKAVKDRHMNVITNGQWSYPALVEPQKGLYMLIAESDLRRNDSGSYLVNADNSEQYQVKLVGPSAFCDGLSPWRFAIVGALADVVESTLVTDLATPCQINDTSWIKPGLSSWIYWAYNHGSKDFALVKQYIDLAAEMGWPYCLVDWEWPEMTNGGDINDVMAYAKQKGVKINLWYNSGTSLVGPNAPQPQDRLNTAESREREMKWLESIGASGIKVDFFSPDNDMMVNYYLDILKDAARHHLLVDFHGCTIPNGWQRTWPNMVSMEGIYGAEWYNNYPLMTTLAAPHNATVVYTRNVIGPMDYTPGTFTDSQYPHITTNAHELALPVLFESGIQHMADRPEGYESLPAEAKQVYSTLPAAWDETRLLSGYPGKSAVVARRSGKKWYIAGINGTDEDTDIAFTLKRVNPKSKRVLLFSDGKSNRDIKVSHLTLNSKQFSIACRARGGFLMVIE